MYSHFYADFVAPLKNGSKNCALKIPVPKMTILKICVSFFGAKFLIQWPIFCHQNQSQKYSVAKSGSKNNNYQNFEPILKFGAIFLAQKSGSKMTNVQNCHFLAWKSKQTFFALWNSSSKWRFLKFWVNFWGKKSGLSILRSKFGLWQYSKFVGNFCKFSCKNWVQKWQIQKFVAIFWFENRAKKTLRVRINGPKSGPKILL